MYCYLEAITAFAAAYLVERGLISWNTKLFDLFPELKSQSRREYYQITLEELLSHRAKIQPFRNGEEFKSVPKSNGNKQERRKQFAEFVLSLPPVVTSDPFVYSNAGYTIASLMLEKAAGTSWEDLIAKVFQKEVNMNVMFGWPNRNADSQPWGHWIDEGKLTALPPFTNYSLNRIEPGGDLSMNIQDYARFIQLNIQGLAGESNLLMASTNQKIHNSESGYAMGWRVVNKDSELASEHAGSDGTFFCYCYIDRKNLIGFVVATNCGEKSMQSGAFAMIDIMKRKYINRKK